MANWPSIPNPAYGFTEEEYFPQIKSESDANYIHVRRRGTRSRKRWNLSWAALSEANYQTLLTFFLVNQGLSFTWTHPATSAPHTCCFASDILPSTHIYDGYRQVSCSIEEI